ncbi:MAG: hypothetical protein ACXW14_11980, partial [Burkholderiaceae bacterium]
LEVFTVTLAGIGGMWLIRRNPLMALFSLSLVGLSVLSGSAQSMARYMLVAALLLLLLGLKPLVTRRADWRASVGVGDEAP